MYIKVNERIFINEDNIVSIEFSTDKMEITFHSYLSKSKEKVSEKDWERVLKAVSGSKKIEDPPKKFRSAIVATTIILGLGTIFGFGLFYRNEILIAVIGGLLVCTWIELFKEFNHD